MYVFHDVFSYKLPKLIWPSFALYKRIFQIVTILICAIEDVYHFEIVQSENESDILNALDYIQAKVGIGRPSVYNIDALLLVSFKTWSYLLARFHRHIQMLLVVSISIAGMGVNQCKIILKVSRCTLRGFCYFNGWLNLNVFVL